jgi:hypothetical protein
VVGDLIFGTIFSYFALNNVQDEIAAQTSGMVSYRAPSFGIFQTKLQPRYWFGIPRNTDFAGLAMDVDAMVFQTVDKNNNQQVTVNFLRAAGSRGSAMEHLVPEQVFSTEEAPAEGISAVKAIAIASAEGQKIWTITNDNLNLALSSINLDMDTETEIRNSVLAGNVATVHESSIVIGDWVGEGYVLLDPNTGAGAYKIAGGSNGGFIDVAGAMFSLFGIALFAAGQGLASPLLAFIVLSLALHFLLIEIILALENEEEVSWTVVTEILFETLKTMVSGKGPISTIIGLFKSIISSLMKLFD